FGHDYNPSPVETIFDYSSQQGFFRSIELCNGSGVCRKTQGGAMCPSYRATRDERDTTRARANALRIALTPSARLPVSFGGVLRPGIIGGEHPSKDEGRAALAERWIAEVMDLCLSCKACKTECP